MQDKRPRFARPQSFSDCRDPLALPRVRRRNLPQFALINNAHRLRIARNRHRPRHQMVGQIPSARVSAPSQLHPAGLAADVERLRALAHEGDATAARRASSEALVWQSSVVVPSDPWVRDPLHAYTPAARREIACAGALSIDDQQSFDESEADDERDPYHPPFLTYIWEAASSRPLPTAFWRGTGAGHTGEVLGDAVPPENAAAAPE